jgi:hypothetical protein
MWIISKEKIAFCAQVEGMRGATFAASPISLQSQCKCRPNESIPKSGHRSPSTPECSCEIGERQSEKNRWYRDGMAIWNVTHGIDARHVVIQLWQDYYPSDEPRRLWRSHSAWMELFFADTVFPCYQFFPHLFPVLPRDSYIHSSLLRPWHQKI